MGASRVVMLTGNPGKAGEYGRVLGRYGVRPEFVAPGPDAAVTAARLLGQGATLVVQEAADIYPPGSDVPFADPAHMAVAVNVSRARAWTLVDGVPSARSYRETVSGYLDVHARETGHGFGWDAAFRNAATGRTYAEDAANGLKNSARDLVMARVIADHLSFERPVDLAFRPAGGSRLVDFGRLPHRHLAGNPWLATPAFSASPVSRLLGSALQGGVFYRSSGTRRERNYWLPGLNGGIPLVPKSDDVHEITFQFHDLMHAVMPDLAYDGATSEGCRRAYILHRMTGEALSLVAADHAFVSTMRQSGCDYDFAKRRIFPLFSSMRPDVGTDEGLRRLSQASARYALLGDEGAMADLGADPAALGSFRSKYERFFVEDYRWTDRNFRGMSEEARLFGEWSEALGPALAAAGVATVTGFAARVSGALGLDGPDELAEVPLDDMVEAVFEACWDGFVAEALRGPGFGSGDFDPDLALSNAFSRWLLGQTVMYRRYAHVPGISAMGGILEAECVRRAMVGERYSRADVDRIRAFHETAVDLLGATRAVSAEEVRLFKEVVPVFDPMFAFYDAKGPSATLSETAASVAGPSGTPAARPGCAP